MEEIRMFEWAETYCGCEEYYRIRREYSSPEKGGVLKKSCSVTKLVIDETDMRISIISVEGKRLFPWEILDILLFSERALALCKQYLQKDRVWPFAVARHCDDYECEIYSLYSFQEFTLKNGESHTRRCFGGSIKTSPDYRLAKDVVEMYIGDLIEIIHRIVPEAVKKFTGNVSDDSIDRDEGYENTYDLDEYGIYEDLEVSVEKETVYTVSMPSEKLGMEI